MRKFKCAGCRAYESKKSDDFASCNHVPYIKNYYCPCVSCLIKGVCNSVCDNYTLYLRWIYDHYPHMLRQKDLLIETLLKDVKRQPKEVMIYKPFIKSTIKYNGDPND